MGFFLDDLIRGIVKHVRREKRLTTVGKWNVAEGVVREYRVVDGEFHRLRPAVDFVYEVNGERHYGATTGCSLNDGLTEIGDVIDAMIRERTTVKIRYDPRDPLDNYFLNNDNPGFPFEIDHDLQ
jgi:hypothetical protein